MRFNSIVDESLGLTSKQTKQQRKNVLLLLACAYFANRCLFRRCTFFSFFSVNANIRWVHSFTFRTSFRFIDFAVFSLPFLSDMIFRQIFLLLFMLLYVGSFALIGRFRRRDREDLCSTDDDEVLVYKIRCVPIFVTIVLHSNVLTLFPILFSHSLWLCTFSLAVAICAALLLPISIASNEVLLLYPLSYYVKWLNSSLVHGEYQSVGNFPAFFQTSLISIDPFQVCGIMFFYFQICRCSCCFRSPTCLPSLRASLAIERASYHVHTKHSPYSHCWQWLCSASHTLCRPSFIQRRGASAHY